MRNFRSSQNGNAAGWLLALIVIPIIRGGYWWVPNKGASPPPDNEAPPAGEEPPIDDNPPTDDIPPIEEDDPAEPPAGPGDLADRGGRGFAFLPVGALLRG